MNMQAMLKQAQKMQNDMMKEKAIIDETIYEGKSSLVSVKVKGTKELVEVIIVNEEGIMVAPAPKDIDETTYMFSPKVLDRANVVEFNPKREDVLKLFHGCTETKDCIRAKTGIATSDMSWG